MNFGTKGVHPNYVYRNPGQELRGPEALENLLTTYRIGLPDLKTCIDDLIVSGDKAVISIMLKGTHTGDLFGIPATGKELTIQGIVLSRLEDGNIIEEWDHGVDEPATSTIPNDFRPSREPAAEGWQWNDTSSVKGSAVAPRPYRGTYEPEHRQMPTQQYPVR